MEHPSQPAPVVVVGDVQPDFTFHLGPDAALRSGPHVEGGGAAANTAVALARLGLDVHFVGKVGDDPLGQRVLDELEAEGIDTSHSAFDPVEPTAQVFALIRPDGEAALARWPAASGADWNLRVEDIPEGLIRAAGWLHTTGISLTRSPVREAVLHAMRIAWEAGIPVSFDLNFRREQSHEGTGFREAIDQAIAASRFVFGHGEDELMAFTGQGSVSEAAHSLAGNGRTVVARLGARGIRVVGAEGQWSEPAIATTVVNTVGAGDAFNGGFIAAASRGRSLQEAVRWGCAVASLKIARGGARALPGREEVEAVLAELDTHRAQPEREAP